MITEFLVALGIGIFSLGYALGRQITMLKNQICRKRAMEDLIKYYEGEKLDVKEKQVDEKSEILPELHADKLVHL